MSHTTTPTHWAVYLRRLIYSVHPTEAEADAVAATLRRGVQRESDVAVKPRRGVHRGWTRTEPEATR